MCNSKCLLSELYMNSTGTKLLTITSVQTESAMDEALSERRSESVRFT